MTTFTGGLEFSGVGVDNTSDKKPIKINVLTHPDHITLNPYWLKWRLTYVGGEEFKRIFLKPFSIREDPNTFLERRAMTYVPAFAKTGINEIRNSIYQRLTDINRVTTSKSYNESVTGKNGGVDRRGSTMEYFLGTEVLKELMVMGKVGIYVDNPNVTGVNYAQSIKIKPYMYVYKAEQIRSWVKDPHGQLLSVLLEDVDYDCDKVYALPITTTKRYRYYWFGDDGYVRCQFYNESGDIQGGEMRLGIKMIPLHILEISESLMSEICDYQIALMNMASSDVQFGRLALFPMYMEKYNPYSALTEGAMQGQLSADGVTPVVQSSDVVRLGGNLKGRKFPMDVDYPEWLAPDTTALVASMAKQKQMQEEIRTLLFLALGNLQATRQSADSKQADVSQEENGLSYIGFELSLAENKICEFWHAYENNTKPFSIKYPQTYDIKSTEVRIKEATGYIPLFQLVPSLTYKKELSKLIVKSLLGGRTPYDELEQIYKEIDDNKLIVDPTQLAAQVEAQLVSHDYASQLLGYPKGEAEKAAEEAAEQAAAIMEAQTPPDSAEEGGLIENPAARGVPGLSADPKADIKKDRNKRAPYSARGKGKKPKDAATQMGNS